MNNSDNKVTTDDIVENKTEIVESAVTKVTENSAEQKVKQKHKENGANQLNIMRPAVILASCLLFLIRL